MQLSASVCVALLIGCIVWAVIALRVYKWLKREWLAPSFVYFDEPEPHAVLYDSADGKVGLFMGNAADRELIPLLSVDVVSAWAEFMGVSRAEDLDTFIELQNYYRRNGYFLLVCRQSAKFWEFSHANM